jgi:tetratricopeptide (TPR) repeat protein
MRTRASLFLAAILFCASITSGYSQEGSRYIIDGLALGAKVHFGSKAYKEYQCVPSETYPGFTWCQNKENDSERRGDFTAWHSILHDKDGTVVYVNRYQEPAYWSEDEINSDIRYYTKKIGEGPRNIIHIPSHQGTIGVIATWGDISVQPIDAERRNLVASGQNLQMILADLIGDYIKSAKENLPLYIVTGGPGFVWVATKKYTKGTLKFTALNPSLFYPAAIQPGPKEAQRQCQSQDAAERLIGCTILINGKGFGSKIDLATALDGRCWAYNDLQQFDRGLADCTSSIALHPKYPYAHLNLGTSLMGLGRFTEAVAAYTKSIELMPTRAETRIGRGRAFLALGDKEAAKKDFEYALMIDPSNGPAKEALAAVYLDIGTSLMGLGRITEAIAAYTKPIELMPTLIDPRVVRGRAFLALRDKEAARRDFQYVLTIDAANQQAKEALDTMDNRGTPSSVSPPSQQQQIPKDGVSSTNEKSTWGTEFVLIIGGVMFIGLGILIFVTSQRRRNSQPASKRTKDARTTEVSNRDERQLRSRSVPSIVISYRRADSAATAGRLFDELVSRFGKEHVFMDIDYIPLGIDYRTYISEVLSKTGVLLAVIGPGWLGDKQHRRIDSPDDLVRIEIQTALQIGVPIIAVVVDYASMPRRDDLPESIEELAFRNAAEVSPGGDFHVHMDRLARGIEAILYGKTTNPVNSGKLLLLDEATPQSS